MRIAHNASLEPALLPRRKAASSSPGMFLPLWNPAALTQIPCRGPNAGRLSDALLRLIRPGASPASVHASPDGELPRPALLQHTWSPRQGNVSGVNRIEKLRAGRPVPRPGRAQRLPNMRTPPCRRKALDTSDAPCDDPDEPLNGAVDAPTDQQATDPTTPHHASAPRQGQRDAVAMKGNASSDAPVDDPDREGIRADVHPGEQALRGEG